MKRTVLELSIEEIEAILDAMGSPDQDTEELAKAREKLNMTLVLMNK